MQFLLLTFEVVKSFFLDGIIFHIQFIKSMFSIYIKISVKIMIVLSLNHIYILLNTLMGMKTVRNEKYNY